MLNDLRQKVRDMDLDPAKIKEEREQYLRENELLRQERDELLDRLEQMQTTNTKSATINEEDFDMGEFLQPPELDSDGVVITEHKVDVVDESHEVEPNSVVIVDQEGVVISDQEGVVIVDHEVEVVHQPQHTDLVVKQHENINDDVQEHDRVNAIDHQEPRALGLQVPYQEFLQFQEFLNFKKFMNQQQQLVDPRPIREPLPQDVGQPFPQPVGQRIPQPVAQPITETSDKAFITLPNGTVIEVIDVGNVSSM